MAELSWRDRSLGQTTLPVFGPEEFAQKISVQMPTANVRLGEQTVACQTFVATQSQGLIVSGLLQSPTSLVPLQELGLRVEMPRAEGGPNVAGAVYLSHSQLQACQAPWLCHWRGPAAWGPGRSRGIWEKNRSQRTR